MNIAMGNTFKALVKREFWENKGSMFYTPGIMAAFYAVFLLILVMFGNAWVENGHYNIDLFDHLPKMTAEFDSINEEDRTKVVQMGLYGTSVSFIFVMLIISLFYCLGSLYDERKDRSILFWKSLPVSDLMTVMSKFVSVTLLIPVCYFIVISAFQIYSLIFATVGAWFGGSSGINIWASSNLFGVMFNMLFSLITVSLWLAPFWAWLMFASSWAKKVAFMWGMLPIFLIVFAEGWIFRSTYLIEVIGERFAEAGMILASNVDRLVDGDMLDGAGSAWYQVFGNMEFWMGLIVTGVFLAGAVFTRRFRDES